MELTLIFVSSLNGKITKGLDKDVEKWASSEDQNSFKILRDGADVLIRSSVTYEIAKGSTKIEKDKLQVIITRNPERYLSEQEEGVLEFVSGDLKDIVKDLEKRGYKKALLSAGSGLAAAFMKEKLVDIFVVTFEPKVFGRGKPMFNDFDGDLELELIKFEKVNDRGTIIGKYRVIKSKA